jgi:hypothetical protein
MNPSESNFDELKRLLKLKRHEVPPPGYFEQFSAKVLFRIRTGEAGGSHTLAEKLEVEAPWLLRVLQIFETKPGLVGAFATSLCLLLMLGVLASDHPDSISKDGILAGLPAESQETDVTSLSAPTTAAATTLAIADAAASESGIAVSTNLVTSLRPTATLFGQQNPLFQPASFAPAGQ